MSVNYIKQLNISDIAKLEALHKQCLAEAIALRIAGVIIASLIVSFALKTVLTEVPNKISYFDKDLEEIEIVLSYLSEAEAFKISSYIFTGLTVAGLTPFLFLLRQEQLNPSMLQKRIFEDELTPWTAAVILIVGLYASIVTVLAMALDPAVEINITNERTLEQLKRFVVGKGNWRLFNANTEAYEKTLHWTKKLPGYFPFQSTPTSFNPFSSNRNFTVRDDIRECMETSLLFGAGLGGTMFLFTLIISATIASFRPLGEKRQYWHSRTYWKRQHSVDTLDFEMLCFLLRYRTEIELENTADSAKKGMLLQRLVRHQGPKHMWEDTREALYEAFGRLEVKRLLDNKLPSVLSEIVMDYQGK